MTRLTPPKQQASTLRMPRDPASVGLELTRSGLPFDVGCTHTLFGHADTGRCQLWIGHQGEHAVMFVREGIRTVRFWCDGTPPRVRDSLDCRCQPWVYGFPRPAWHEGADSCITAADDLVVSRPTTRRSVADAMLHRPKVHPVSSTVAELRQLFVDPHVHAALITVDRVLITIVDRGDVTSALPANTPATSLGTLLDRTIGPFTSLDAARQKLRSTGRRRLAVIDEQQRLHGLLCLKRGQDGFCSDQDLESRQAEAAYPDSAGVRSVDAERPATSALHQSRSPVQPALEA